MFQPIQQKGTPSGHPISGTVKSGGLVLTVQVPTDPYTNELVSGGIEAQTRQVFANLQDSMEAAGGSLADVMLVQVYLVNSADWAAMHQIWAETFQAPYPSRATVVVKELMLEGMLIEIVANAHVDAGS